MVRTKIYPNYCNYYYYNEGDNFILLIRKTADIEVHRKIIEFDSVEEAKMHFGTECGA